MRKRRYTTSAAQENLQAPTVETPCVVVLDEYATYRCGRAGSGGTLPPVRRIGYARMREAPAPGTR
ncbi:hypothetical protein [Corynebacterium sp.]|uniref:hypothetical protein n=1 Tax=Corynebacterium sp. TaxID=1720 RepID=UPI003B3A6667